MIARKAYKFRLMAHEAQAAHLGCFAGHCRFVWNKMLAEQKARLDSDQSCEQYNTFAKYLPAWKSKAEFEWLRVAPVAALQQKLKDLDRAIKDACDKKSRAGFGCQSCGYTKFADMNAVINILAAGHVVLAGGAESLDTAMKPEPLIA